MVPQPGAGLFDHHSAPLDVARCGSSNVELMTRFDERAYP